MRRVYYINGWEETREYFIRTIGRIDDEQLELLKNGDTITKNDNTFRIENWDGI